MVRALILSHLTAIYIKQSLGALSALCGCVVASIGSSCGITYLMGGNYANVCNSVKNMIANLTGMICDGAKAQLFVEDILRCVNSNPFSYPFNGREVRYCG